MKFRHHHFKFCTNFPVVPGYMNIEIAIALTLLLLHAFVYRVGGGSNGWLELNIFVFKALFIKINQYLSSKQWGHGSFICQTMENKTVSKSETKKLRESNLYKSNKTTQKDKDRLLGWYSYYIHVNDYFYINLRFMWPVRLTRKVEKYGRSERDSNPDPPTLLFNPFDCCLISLKLSLLSKTYRQ